MKRLNLDETWRLCLSMWRWIAKEKRTGSRISVPTLKARWVKKYGFGAYEINGDCFFCEYIDKRSRHCDSCPPCKVDNDFACNHKDYHYASNPIAFYNKLVSLNRKRLKAKKTSKK